MQRSVKIYVGRNGKAPFEVWVQSLRDLLCGGDKSTQSRDIEAAKTYWQEFNR